MYATVDRRSCTEEDRAPVHTSPEQWERALSDFERGLLPWLEAAEGHHRTPIEDLGKFLREMIHGRTDA